MPKVDWLHKIKDYSLGAICTGIVTAAFGFVYLVLANDKKLDILVYQVSVILEHIAPNVPKTPDAADTARDKGLATVKE